VRESESESEQERARESVREQERVRESKSKRVRAIERARENEREKQNYATKFMLLYIQIVILLLIHSCNSFHGLSALFTTLLRQSNSGFFRFWK
jgi:hypothetical protein